MAVEKQDIVIRVNDLVVGFGDRIVLDRLSLSVERGEILGLVGGSGSGKSVLMRAIIGLLPRREGRIKVLGVDLDRAGSAERSAVEQRWGVLYQHGFPRTVLPGDEEFRNGEASRYEIRLGVEYDF